MLFKPPWETSISIGVRASIENVVSLDVRPNSICSEQVGATVDGNGDVAESDMPSRRLIPHVITPKTWEIFEYRYL